MDKNRGNNNRSWVKSIGNTLDKSRHRKLNFTIFISKDVDWTISVQSVEQQQLVKEKIQHLEYGRHQKTRRTNAIL